MKKYILIILGISLSLKISGQSAETMLQSVVDKTKSYEDISVLFNYTLINEESGIKEKSRGYGSIKGNAYKINIDTQELICNGETLWTYFIDDEEVMVSDATEDNDSNPLSIINSLADNVNVRFVDYNTIGMTIEVTEKEPTIFEKVHIGIDNDFKIKDIHIFIGDGNELIYEITEFKTNQNLPDDFFIFNETLHPNVEVIDMR